MLLHPKKLRLASCCALAMVFLVPLACRRDPHLVGKDIKKVTVHTVAYYGRTLDQSANPQDVAYVLLHAIYDDMKAGGDDDKRQEALDKQLDVAAVDTIVQTYMQAHSKSSLAPEEALYEMVYYWTPIAGHYVDSFDLDYAAALGKMSKTLQSDTAAQIFYPVQNTGDNSKATLVITLAKEKGYWRVSHLDYVRRSPEFTITGKTK